MDHQAGQNEGFSTAGQVGSAGSEALHIWRPRPLVRAIKWTANDAGATNEKNAYEVFVMQDTLTEILKRVYASTSRSEFGFLVGDLCECPETGIRYVVMTSTIQARNRFDENGTPQIPAEAYVAMQLKLDRRVGGLVGWYHVHRDADEISLSENDIATHEKYFSEPWQSALIVAPTPDGPLGGFFRRAGGNLAADVCRPFYEVLTARSFVARGVRHTCMNWRNYGSEGDTVLIPYEGADGTTTDLPASPTPVPEPMIVAPPPVEEVVEPISMDEPSLAAEPVLEQGPSIPESAFIPPPPLVEEPPAAVPPLLAEEPVVVEEPPAPEPPSAGGIAADFADLKEAAPETDGWTAGHEGTPQEDDPLYSAELGQGISRLADRQGELPDQRFAGMRAAYPAPESPASAETPATRDNQPGGPLAAAAGLGMRPEPAHLDEAAVDAEADTASVPAPAKRKRQSKSRRSRKSRSSRRRSGISGRRVAMAGIAVVVLAAGGFAALKLPAFFGGDRNAATVRRPLAGTEGPAIAGVGGLDADAQNADAAGLGTAGVTTGPTPDAVGTDPSAAGGQLAAGDSASTGDQLLADAELPGEGAPSIPAGDAEDPSSVANEVARLAKPLPDRAYAAPVLAIDGGVVELNDERARRAAARRRALEQAAADSNAEAQLRTIRRPTVSAPAPVAGDPGLTDVSIDRPELLQKLDRLSDTLSAALNAYFVETLAFQNDEGSCDDVTQALERVDDSWKAYNGALGSPRVVAFEGARAARDVQLSERFQEVQSSYSSLDCDR